jgi:hypothetical protein
MPARKLPDLALDELQTHSLFDVPCKVQMSHLGRPCGPEATVACLISNLPDQLAARSLRIWVDAIVASVRAKRAVFTALGGHVVKAGCTPYLIDWIKRGILTGVCMNGAAAIHDLELALAGRTSEDVEARLSDGSFGMSRETAEFFAAAAAVAAANGMGLGSALGRRLIDSSCHHPEASILRTAAEADLPCTVHVAIGTDVVHMHKMADGAAIGASSMADFRLACRMVASLAGGVWMNLGSAVVLPEVFLKAVSIANNLGHDLSDMTVVNLDMIQHYRAKLNVVERHESRGATGITVTGHHEIMIPLVHAAVVNQLARSGPVE